MFDFLDINGDDKVDALDVYLTNELMDDDDFEDDFEDDFDEDE